MYFVTIEIDGETDGVITAEAADEMAARLWSLLANFEASGASVIGDPNVGFIAIKDCAEHGHPHEVIVSRVHHAQNALAN